MLVIAALAMWTQAGQALAPATGEQFEGGAKAKYGASQFGQRTNFVYAQPTVPLCTMSWHFRLEHPPASGVLWLKARDDDAHSKTQIEIDLNGKRLMMGPNGFSSERFSRRSFPIGQGILRDGDNELTITNIQLRGAAGMPPWFMVAEAAIGPPGFDMKPSLEQDFYFTLPSKAEPIPHPLAKGQKPGFAIRGIKGWGWLPKQYLATIPTLAKHGGNFLMNCYTSMWDIEHQPMWNGKANRWWEPLPEAKKRAYAQVVEECQKHGIEFCFSMNPNLAARRPLDYHSKEDLESLWRHYAWMQGLGVHWFNVSLDDISHGIDASGQVAVVNEIFRRLRLKDPNAQFIFCPTYYWGNGTEPEYRPYLETIANELNSDIYLFWTGDQVVGPITTKAAASYRAAVKHKLFLWDNYPVNDGNPTMHLGPVIKRDSDLSKSIDGYMANSMKDQSEINLLPVLTCMDYAYNPAAYDPAKSIGAAIWALSQNAAQREALRELVLTYPGMLVFYQGEYNTSYNPVRESFRTLIAQPHHRFAAEQMIDRIETLRQKLQAAFPTQYRAEKDTLEADVQWMRGELLSKYG